jgi:hypothetical protein
MTCDTSFGSLKALDLHKKVHQPQFGCNQCEKAFYVQSSLNDHLEAHTAFGVDDVRLKAPQTIVNTTLVEDLSSRPQARTKTPCKNILGDFQYVSRLLQQSTRTPSSVSPTTQASTTTWSTVSRSASTPATMTLPSSPSAPVTPLLTTAEIEQRKRLVHEHFVQGWSRYVRRAGDQQDMAPSNNRAPYARFARTLHNVDYYRKSNARTFGCEMCTKYFPDSEAVNSHIRAVHVNIDAPVFPKNKNSRVPMSDGTVLCPPCGDQHFAGLDAYQRHYRQKHHDFSTGR